MSALVFRSYLAYATIFSLDYLIERIWAELSLVKVYTKKRGVHPDIDDPVCLRKGATIEVIPYPGRIFNSTNTGCRTCVTIFTVR